LETIKSIIATLSSGIINRMDHLQQFLKIVITECMENLKEPELKLAKPCGKILMYCAMASGKQSKSFLEGTVKIGDN
jgi:DNA repair/transcription protein MET18/MMS19